MSNSEWFIIPNLSQFTDKTRSIVYNNFGSWQNKSGLDILIDGIKETEQEEFNRILSHQESLLIIRENIKKEKNKKTNKTRYVLNDTMFSDIIHKLNNRMVSNIINILTQKGLIETAFDNEANDFVFWINDEQKNNYKKPEAD